MGSLCSSCFGSEDSDEIMPSQEERRQQILDATEKRISNEQNRGIKNPERVSRLQKKAEERDRLEAEAAKRYDGEGGLKWQVG